MAALEHGRTGRAEWRTRRSGWQTGKFLKEDVTRQLRGSSGYPASRVIPLSRSDFVQCPYSDVMPEPSLYVLCSYAGAWIRYYTRCLLLVDDVAVERICCDAAPVPEKNAIPPESFPQSLHTTISTALSPRTGGRNAL